MRQWTAEHRHEMRIRDISELPMRQWTKDTIYLLLSVVSELPMRQWTFSSNIAPIF